MLAPTQGLSKIHVCTTLPSKTHIFLSSEAHLAQKVGDKGLWTWVRTEKDSTKSSGVPSNCSVPVSAMPQGGKSPLEFQLRPKYSGIPVLPFALRCWGCCKFTQAATPTLSLSASSLQHPSIFRVFQNCSLNSTLTSHHMMVREGTL